MVVQREVSSIHKEASRFMWIVKGQLIPDGYREEDIVEVYDSYFKRLWGNHENCVHEEGFEEAYNRRYK
jgi:hypothetical protein